MKFFRKYQKNRFYKLPKKIKYIYGNSLIFLKNELRIELIHLTMIKYCIKHFLKKKIYSIDFDHKIWYFGNLNFFLQKKSKNSRMGKGKGMLERQVIRLRNQHVLLEFSGFSNKKLKIFLKNILKKTKLNLFLSKKFERNYSNWCKKNIYLNYFNKYHNW